MGAYHTRIMCMMVLYSPTKIIPIQVYNFHLKFDALGMMDDSIHVCKVSKNALTQRFFPQQTETESVHGISLLKPKL